MNNIEYALSGKQVIDFYQKQTGNTPSDALQDLLADLQHWAEAEIGQDFLSSLNQAMKAFKEETGQ